MAEKPKPPIYKVFTRELAILDFDQINCMDCIEFFRFRATRFFCEELSNNTAIVIFEHQFDPMRVELDEKIGYKVKDISLRKAMDSVFDRYGLAYKIVPPNKVIIMDKQPLNNHKKVEQGAAGNPLPVE